MKAVNLVELDYRGKQRVMATYVAVDDEIKIMSDNPHWRELAKEIADEGVRVGSKRYSLKDGIKFLKALSMEYDGKKFWATEVFDYEGVLP